MLLLDESGFLMAPLVRRGWALRGQPPALEQKVGHREKFGNDPEKHKDFSAVTHVAKDKGIPPFLVLYVAGHPHTTARWTSSG